MSPARGRFITFEGLDGSGKSTHLVRAGAWLEARGHRVRLTKEPGGTPLGEAIRGVFLDPRWGRIDGRVEALLVFASRRQHLVELIEPELERGVDVLCDRFTDSSMAYQGAARGLGRAFVEDLDRLATGGRVPDHTLLFDLDAETASRRGRSHGRRRRGDVDRLDDEDLDFYRAVRQAYLELLESAPERFSRIDSSAEKEVTWRQVEVVLERLFPPGEAA